MAVSILFKEYQFTSNGWVLTCKNSYLEELIQQKKSWKIGFWGKFTFPCVILYRPGMSSSEELIPESSSIEFFWHIRFLLCYLPSLYDLYSWMYITLKIPGFHGFTHPKVVKDSATVAEFFITFWCSKSWKLWIFKTM